MRQQGHCQEGKFESNKCCSQEVLKTLRNTDIGERHLISLEHICEQTTELTAVQANF